METHRTMVYTLFLKEYSQKAMEKTLGVLLEFIPCIHTNQAYKPLSNIQIRGGKSHGHTSNQKGIGTKE